MKTFIISSQPILILLLMLSSCEWDPYSRIPPDDRTISIYPGECLSSTMLGYVAHNRCVLSRDENGSRTGLAIGFKIYWDVIFDRLDCNLSCCIPSRDVYDKFGAESRRVKKAYNDIFDAYCERVNPTYPFGITSTIYYCGGLVMTADKEFAGVPAGENLESVIVPFSNNPEIYGITPIPTIDVPDGYSIIGKSIGIYFPIDDHELVAGEYVTFHLEIPVKVGLLLSLLRDRLTDPDAQMQYRDEVLTCDFTINHGLH